MAVISYQKTESEALEQIKKAIPDSMKENLVKKSKGLFAELFESKIFPNHYLACSIDGIGTKLLIAAALDKYDTVGIDLVAMCANDLATLGNVQPFLFMDYLAVQEKVELKAGDIIRGIVKGLEMCDTAGIFRNDVKINFGKGETASIGEMLDSFKEGYGFDLAAAMIGFVPKNFRQKEIVAGDKIIALRSSGLHSNGYTDARKFLLRGDFETRKSNKAFYRGKFSLNDKLDAIDGKEGKTIGEVLLEPTRIYVKPVAEVAKKFSVVGVNSTGYGLKNFNRFNAGNAKVEFVIEAPLEPQKIFSVLQKESGFSDEEMYQTFNMGMGFYLIVSEKDANDVLDILKNSGEDAKVVGFVRKADRIRTILKRAGKDIVFEGY